MKEKIAQNTNNLSNLFHGQAQAEYYLVGPNIILMALYSINSLFPPFESRLHRTSILPHKQCFWYGKQDESHSHFILYWKMSWITPAYVGIRIKLYSSKCFIQYNPEVKNNRHSLFLQESPAKDGLLLFKYLKLSYRDTEPNSWLPTSSHALLFPCKRASWFLFN